MEPEQRLSLGAGSQTALLPDESTPGRGLEFKTLLHALRRRWLLAFSLAGLLASAATVAVWCRLPTRHTARTLLWVDSTQPSLLVGQLEGGQGNYQRTQLALVKSHLVLRAALRKDTVARLPTIMHESDPVRWLEDQIKADYKIAPEIMCISLTGNRAEDLAPILNAVSETYMRDVVEKEQHERRARLEQLKTLFKDYSIVLNKKRSTLHEIAEQAGSGDAKTLEFKHRFALERLALAQKELLQLQSDLRKARVEAASQEAREKLKIRVPESVIDQRIRQDTVVEQHTQEVAKLEQTVEQLKKTFVLGEKAPIVVSQQSKLDAARKALEKRKEYLRPILLKELQEKAKDEFETSTAQAQSRIDILTELEKSVARDVEQMSKQNHAINKSSLDMESLREDQANTKELTQRIASQIEGLKVELRAPSRVRLLEEASVTANETKKRLMASGGVGLGVLVLGLFAVAWLESRACRISTPDEVKQAAGIRVVGTLPMLPSRDTHRFKTNGQASYLSADQRLLVESLDAMRTVLLHRAGTEKFKAVMVTSALSGEGKTSLSSQLAASLARGGFNTLLIDGDMRRPTLHRIFGLPQEPGLCELLRGKASLDQIIQPTLLPGLSLISAGQFDGAVLQALAQGKSKDVFDSLKARYGLVVVDSTPVLPVADALLLAQYVDGVVFSILRDVSRLPPLLAACERIGMLGIRLLGAVMAGIHASRYFPCYAYHGGDQTDPRTDLRDGDSEVDPRPLEQTQAQKETSQIACER
jgi:capsular exopolysaccharide synthesis family protein